MATQKRISDYVSNSAFEVPSSAIVIVDSNDEKEDVIKDSEILRDISDSQPGSSHKTDEHENPTDGNTSEHASDQSNYSSDEEGIDEDLNTQVNVLCL